MEVEGDTYTLLELPTKENGYRINHAEMTEINEMLEGEMEIFTGGQQLLVKAGESYSSAPGVSHRGSKPGTKHSHFHWTLVPTDSLKPTFEQVVGNYMTGRAACGMLGHFAILCLEQYLLEGLTGKDYVTGEPVSAEESLREAGSFIDKAGGLKAVCESAKILEEGKAYVAGIAPRPISEKLFELLAVVVDHRMLDQETCARLVSNHDGYSIILSSGKSTILHQLRWTI
ncbi:hypothetical protein BDV11DRAFT_172168 [Aspergillus similis]